MGTYNLMWVMGDDEIFILLDTVSLSVSKLAVALLDAVARF
jgi:hypothetical protein